MEFSLLDNRITEKQKNRPISAMLTRAALFLNRFKQRQLPLRHKNILVKPYSNSFFQVSTFFWYSDNNLWAAL